MDVCPLKVQVPPDPEDGISEEVNMMLRERSKMGKVRAWQHLWSLLFPQDQPLDIPQPGK